MSKIQNFKMYINGEWVDSSSGKKIETLNDLTDEDTNLVGKMFQTAKDMALKFGIDKSGYRTIFNCNEDGGQTVYHIHLHLVGGRTFGWPPG